MSDYILVDDKKYYVCFYGPDRETEVWLEGNLFMTVTSGSFYDFQITENFGGYHFVLDKHPIHNLINMIDAILRKYHKKFAVR